MHPFLLHLALLASLAAVGGVLVIQPFIARRGLLFGVYVGEERWAGAEAARLTRAWYVAMAAAVVVSLAVGEALIVLHPVRPVGVGAALVVLSILSSGVYLFAYLQARKLALAGGQPAAAALVAHTRFSLALPLAALAFGVGGGLVSVGYAWLHYADLPAVIPMHFGPSGRPDAWSPRSFWSVMLAPLTTLLLGIALGTIACFVARAKRAIRFPDRGVSLDAQQRFRGAAASFVSGSAILATTLLTTVSIFSVRSALGLADGMPPFLMIVGGALVVYAVGGSLVLAIRYGQGGARLERSVDAPLTNGLADNSRWKLGVFYVNRRDPSMFVEKRFGLGYTINFGNPKALALLVAFMALALAIAFIGAHLPQSQAPPR